MEPISSSKIAICDQRPFQKENTVVENPNYPRPFWLARKQQIITNSHKKFKTCRHKFPMFPSAPCDVTRSLQSSSPEPVRLMRAIWNRTTTLWLKMCNREFNYINKIRRILWTGFVLAGFFSWPCARNNYPSRKFIQPQLWYFQSSGELSNGKIFSDTGVATKEKCGVSRSGVCWRLAQG